MNEKEIIFCKAFNAEIYTYSFNMDKFYSMFKEDFAEFLYNRTNVRYSQIIYCIDRFKTFIIDNNEGYLEVLDRDEKEIFQEYQKRLKNSKNYKDTTTKKETSLIDKIKNTSEKLASKVFDSH